MADALSGLGGRWAPANFKRISGTRKDPWTSGITSQDSYLLLATK